jgi:hypothetical protein
MERASATSANSIECGAPSRYAPVFRMSEICVALFVIAVRPIPLLGCGINGALLSRIKFDGTLCCATSRNVLPSNKLRRPKFAPQTRVAFLITASKTTCRSPGRDDRILSTSIVASWCSTASSRSRSAAESWSALWSSCFRRADTVALVRLPAGVRPRLTAPRGLVTCTPVLARRFIGRPQGLIMPFYQAQTSRSSRNRRQRVATNVEIHVESDRQQPHVMAT